MWDKKKHNKGVTNGQNQQNLRIDLQILEQWRKLGWWKGDPETMMEKNGHSGTKDMILEHFIHAYL